VHLAIVSGPGELPTGRAIDFAPNTDIDIRDGEAAIAMRSWQSGVTRVRASSAGLKDAVIEVRTLAGPPFVPGVTPLVADRPYIPFKAVLRDRPGDQVFGLNNPTFATSNAPDRASQLVNDGNPATYWSPEPGDTMAWVTIDLERVVEVHRLTLIFPQAAPYGFIAEVKDAHGIWRKLVEQIEGQESAQSRTLETEALSGREVRISLRVPKGAIAGLAEAQVSGNLKTD
jgi:hypothetical protein